MAGPTVGPQAPEQPQDCSFASFPPSSCLWSCLRSCCTSPSLLPSFLPSCYLCKSHSWPISLPSLQYGSRCSHVAFRPCSGTIPTSCKTGDPWGPRDLIHSSSRNYLPFLLKKWVCLCYVTGNRIPTGNWKTKIKISYFNWLLLKRLCFTCQDPLEHRKDNSRVRLCLKPKPRLNLKQKLKRKPNQKHKSKPNVQLYS